MSYDVEYCKKYEPVFGSWYVKQKLGEGNYGAVFEIEREDFGTKYHAALKVISIPKNRSELESLMNENIDASLTERYIEQVVERIVKEFELMSKLKGNSHVVSYEDHQVIRHNDDAGWDILIRMELLTPMHAYLKEHELTRRDVVKIGIDICKALELCRKHDIIHRDIKPENIFVSESGDFKLGDFGIAKQVEESQSELTTIGTPTYMAPEVVNRQPYDASVDMYSLGVVLYRYLNHNRTPFMPPYPFEIKVGDKEAAFGKRVSGKSVLPAPTNAGSKQLSDIILKACSFSPKSRYSSPAHMRKALEEVLAREKEGILATPLTGESNVAADEDATQLMTSQKRYVVPPNETVVFKNTNDRAISFQKVSGFPVDIIKTAGETREMITNWNGSSISLKPGEQIQILNKNDNQAIFCVVFDKVVVAANNEGGKTKKTVLVPILIGIILILVVALAGLLVFLNKDSDGEKKQESVVTYNPVDETVVIDTNDEMNTVEDESEGIVEPVIVPEYIDGLPEIVEIDVGKVYELVPLVMPTDAEYEAILFSSSDELIATVTDKGIITAVSEGKSTVRVGAGEAVCEVLVNVTDKQKVISAFKTTMTEVTDALTAIQNAEETDLSQFEERIKTISEFAEMFKNEDALLVLNYYELEDTYRKLTEEIKPACDALKNEVDAAVAKALATCDYCGSESHSVHPVCNYCGSYNHTSHPKCSYCGSYDHTTHPQCSYCGSYDHATHPKCSYCGSYDHTTHPKCSYCGSYDHTVHPKCNICQSPDHTVHPAISVDL